MDSLREPAKSTRWATVPETPPDPRKPTAIRTSASPNKRPRTDHNPPLTPPLTACADLTLQDPFIDKTENVDVNPYDKIEHDLTSLLNMRYENDEKYQRLNLLAKKAVIEKERYMSERSATKRQSLEDINESFKCLKKEYDSVMVELVNERISNESNQVELKRSLEYTDKLKSENDQLRTQVERFKKINEDQRNEYDMRIHDGLKDRSNLAKEKANLDKERLKLEGQIHRLRMELERGRIR
ncbi:hypothetical protein V865_008517 [Kwoniella europaea PYCC6329]|uniref:Uncharacterized protein n=1 Tax=Kwoniella europaea PYCC6329 TaxID=1423913 RepID=A0AAX4KVI0_9TREE